MNNVIKALNDITPAGLFDVCRAFDTQLMTKDGSVPVCNIEQADKLDFNDVNRQEVIDQLSNDKDFTLEDIVNYLGID